MSTTSATSKTRNVTVYADGLEEAGPPRRVAHSQDVLVERLPPREQRPTAPAWLDPRMTAIDDWLDGSAGPPDAARLPPQQPHCVGCGPALFIQVGFEHFPRNRRPDARARAEQILDKQCRSGQDASAW